MILNIQKTDKINNIASRNNLGVFWSNEKMNIADKFYKDLINNESGFITYQIKSYVLDNPLPKEKMFLVKTEFSRYDLIGIINIFESAEIDRLKTFENSLDNLMKICDNLDILNIKKLMITFPKLVISNNEELNKKIIAKTIMEKIKLQSKNKINKIKEITILTDDDLEYQKLQFYKNIYFTWKVIFKKFV